MNPDSTLEPKRRRRGVIPLLAGLLIGLGPGLGHGADTALLIGIEAYPSLPVVEGVGRDLEMMREVTDRLGFERVKTLADARAHRQAVLAALRDWLPEGVRRSDRVLIYFSGHGSRILDRDGDEQGDDGADEVLVLYDARPAPGLGHDPAHGGLLVDDELGHLLGAIPSERVLVILDACHSGTATKAFDWGRLLGLGGGAEAQSHDIRASNKFASYPGIPPSDGGDMGLSDPQANYVAIAAAGDGETALPSREGSYFTRGVYRAVLDGFARSSPITPRVLMEEARAYIHARVGPPDTYTPRLSGNPALSDRSLLP
jgi:hypothetical protein